MGSENWRKMNAEEFGEWAVGKTFVCGKHSFTCEFVKDGWAGYKIGSAGFNQYAIKFIQREFRLIGEYDEQPQTSELERLRQVNAVYREALDRYADAGWWSCEGCIPDASHDDSCFQNLFQFDDGYKPAQDAIKKGDEIK